MLYNNLSGYLKKKYHTRVRKICIDGGFSCPNRDGTAGHGGCIYCSERGSGEHIEAGLSIRRQVAAALEEAKDEDRFIAYFQNFTNTYAECSVLRERYDSALIDTRIVALAIGTRPDCINEEIAALIASYKDRLDVWVELGLQSADDGTAKLINRGYESSVYAKACEVLHRYGIPFVTHIMIGLPGEGMAELEKTVNLVNSCRSWGIKIHSVYVVRGTRLAEMYGHGEYVPITMDEYISRAAYVLTHISPDAVVHRLTGDCPRDLLVAPLWNTRKNEVIDGICNKMVREELSQGCRYASVK